MQLPCKNLINIFFSKMWELQEYRLEIEYYRSMHETLVSHQFLHMFLKRGKKQKYDTLHFPQKIAIIKKIFWNK